MRYFIETNIFFFHSREPDELSREVKNMLEDYENLLVMSVESVRELLMVGHKKNIKSFQTFDDIKKIIHEHGIEIRYITESHLQTLSRIIPDAPHSDPADLMIIAQAITEKIPLISSDTKFPLYTRHGLDFIFNDRTK